MAQGVAQTPTPFAAIVDGYLDRFAAYHPSIAAGNGLHGHDGELEDFSAPAIAAEVKWLRATRQTLGCRRRRTAHAGRAGGPPHPAGHHRWLAAGSGHGPDLDPQSDDLRHGHLRRRAQPDDDGVVCRAGEDAAGRHQAAPRAGAAVGGADQYPAAAARLRGARGGHVPRRRGPPRIGICRLAFAEVQDPSLQAALRGAADAARVARRAVRDRARDDHAGSGNRQLCDRHGERRGQVPRRGADRYARGDAAGDRRARIDEDAGGVHSRRFAGGSAAARPSTCGATC